MYLCVYFLGVSLKRKYTGPC